MNNEGKNGTSSPSFRVGEENHLYVSVKPSQWPIVYSPDYNIGFLGLEKLHPFDSGKWGKIVQFLKDGRMITDATIVQPREASEEDLLVVHTKQYLSELKWSLNVARITEVLPVAFMPNCVVQWKVLRPFRYHTGGTILAGKLAMERGWAINVGGGFHHCSADRGGGFCAYADITLTIQFLFQKAEGVSRAMIIDLDAHQGNGHERDFMNDSRVYIMDVYNRGIYPQDGFAKRGIKRKVELQHFTADGEYLSLVNNHVEGALNEFQPDIVVYNAGTDILDGDPLGNLSISPEGIVARDQIVFQKVRSRGIPILMVTSGGYLRTNARIIADSIINLHSQGLVSCGEAELAVHAELSSQSSLSRSRSDSGIFKKLRLSLSRSSTEDVGHSESATSAHVKPSAGSISREGSKQNSLISQDDVELHTTFSDILASSSQATDTLLPQKSNISKVSINDARPELSESSSNNLLLDNQHLSTGSILANDTDASNVTIPSQSTMLRQQPSNATQLKSENFTNIPK